jgi:deoxyribonuclease IV
MSGDPAETVDELGAHVSTAGGVDRAPARAREVESVCLQLFTKQPNRWAEPVLKAETAHNFHQECDRLGIRTTVAHDSYLINLATPDADLWERSYTCFRGELERCCALGIDFMVTHPGNATDGDLDAGLARNAEGVARALQEVSGKTRIALELTAGSGTTVGATFENLARILEGIPGEHRDRAVVCFDTCHAYSAGYDLVGDYDGVWQAFDAILGLDRLAVFHVNDSRHPFASRKDRHEHLGEGTLGAEPFRRLMLDERFRAVPKLLETPKGKGDEGIADDLRNLNFLRAFRS